MVDWAGIETSTDEKNELGDMQDSSIDRSNRHFTAVVDGECLAMLLRAGSRDRVLIT